jgi:hypothetical protein
VRTKPKLKKCGAPKRTACPCSDLQIGGQQDGRNPLVGIPTAQPWTPPTKSDEVER